MFETNRAFADDEVGALRAELALYFDAAARVRRARFLWHRLFAGRAGL
jgi:hypothetical protein